MKNNIYRLSIIVVICITITSCKKFLEKQPIGKTGKETLFETVNGATQAMNGAYNQMLYYYKNEFGMYGDIAADNLIRGTKGSTMSMQFNYQSTTGDDELAVGHIWFNIYEALNNTNNILNAVPTLKTKFPDQTSTLDHIYGQALVLRALCHFDLSRTYAQPYNYTADASHLGIPVLTKTPSPGAEIPRNSMKETYDQIITDLTASLPYLQKSANQGSQLVVSYQAALALLSRVYLYKGDWAQSISYANLVINDAGYQLASATNYKSIFNAIPSATSPKVESIFVLTNTGFNPQSTNIYNVYSDDAAAQYTSSVKTINLFDVDDTRLTNMFTKPREGDNIGKSLTKKYGDGKVSATTPQLIQVIRLSELYLNRAEAQWNLQKYAEAAEDLRIIAQRAHSSRTIAITYSSPNELYKQIADERNRELCFENHRLFDILRRKENLQRGVDCNSTVCSLPYPNNKFVLPIPIKEIEANRALVPNPGYN